MSAAKQFVIVAADAVDESVAVARVAFFDEDGQPVDLGGGSAPVEVGIDDVDGLAAALADKADAGDIPDVSGFASESDLSDLADRVAALEGAGE